MQYVGFWWRVLAALIDGVILWIVYIPVMIVFGGSMMSGVQADAVGAPDVAAMGASMVLMNLITLIIYVAYEAVFTSSKMMATPGKRILGFAVLTDTGHRLSVGRAIGRSLGKILSQITLMIGFLMVAFTGKKQGLHDMVASTVVVKRSALAVATEAENPTTSISEQM